MKTLGFQTFLFDPKAKSWGNSLTKKPYLNAMRQALDGAFNRLKHNGSAPEAVCILEDCELFSAGKGSVFTAKGEHEMDASVMEGRALMAGAVAGNSWNKKSCAAWPRVCSRTRNMSFWLEKGAMEWAHQERLKFETDSYFFTQQRYDQ